MSDKPDNFLLAALLGILPYAENEIAHLHTTARRDGEHETEVEAEEAQMTLDTAYEALRRVQKETSEPDQFWMEAVRQKDRLCAIPACAQAYGISTLEATNFVNHYEASIS